VKPTEKITKRAVVVDANAKGTNKTAPRSEQGSPFKKGRKGKKEREKGLDTLGIVRDVRLRELNRTNFIRAGRHYAMRSAN